MALFVCTHTEWALGGGICGGKCSGPPHTFKGLEVRRMSKIYIDSK